MIFAVCAIYLVQTYLLMRLLYVTAPRPNGLILIFNGFLWFIPLLADTIYCGMRNQAPALSFFALCSPLGTISQALNKPVDGTWTGISIQAAICLLMALLFIRAQTRRRRRLTALGMPANL
jgi:hypothetical protein